MLKKMNAFKHSFGKGTISPKGVIGQAMSRANAAILLLVVFLLLALPVLAEDMPIPIAVELTTGADRCEIIPQDSGLVNTYAIATYKDGVVWRKLLSVRESRWQGVEDCAHWLRKMDAVRVKISTNRKGRKK